MKITVLNKDIVSVETENPDIITEHIQRSKLVNGEVLVKFDMGEMHILKNLGYPGVPSPMQLNYNYPGMYKPFAHQRVTAEFLSMHRRAYCLSDMGTGKTMSAIWAADYLMTIGAIKRVLIVAPLSILDAAWRRDLFRTVMHRTVEIAHGDREKRIRIINGGAEFVIINYDGIPIIEKELAKGGFDLVIVDELTHYKCASTARFRSINRILTPDTWVWGMTGTPAAQRPTDAYGLAKLLLPSKAPRTFSAFRDMVQTKVSNFTYVNKPEAEDIIHAMLQPAIRFTKEECLDLPELLYQTREVPLSAQQEKYYKLLKKEMLVRVAGEELSAANAAVALNKMLQLSAGSVYTDSGGVFEFDVSPRINELLAVVEEAAHKIIVFVMFRHTIELIEKTLLNEGYTVGVIHGGISSSKRNEVFNNFQTTKDPHILIIQPQAAAHGVTLHAANTIIWWGITLSLETYLQANARIHRAGQVNACNVVHLVGSTVEKKVLKVLETKGAAQTKLLDLYKDVVS